MSKRLILILALAFVVGLACTAYAEVQNVKVGGDLSMSGVSRDNFGLNTNTAGNKHFDKESMFMSQIRLRIDADLTDNVATTVRLINERDWEQESVASTDIDLDLAYVTLKEFLYSPLSLTVGRQEIKFGNGLIIGNAKNYAGAGAVFAGVPTDLSLRKAFDAIRATLNYDPLVVDLVYSKIRERFNRGTTAAPQNDDQNLYGINASYDIRKDTKVEAYLFNKTDHNDAAVAATNKPDMVNTIGALVSTTAVPNLKASLEGAYQFGHRRVASGQTDYKAWALQGMATYDIKAIKQLDKYAPQVGVSYTYLSGNKVTDESDYQLWDAMFYDQAQVLNSIPYAIIPFSNLQVLNLKANAKPMEDVTLLANYGYYRLAQKASTLTAPFSDSDGTAYYTATPLRGKKELGSALDLTAIYDYTEDVQFGLTSGIFFPGAAYDNKNGKAYQLIGSMKVTF